MNPDLYGDDMDYGMDAADNDYAGDDVDDMLDALIESDDDDYSERKKKGRRGQRGRGGRKGAPPTASGASAYRSPTPQGPVTQTQLKEALAKVGTDVRRNAEGIKTVNAQMGRLTDQVKDVVSVTGAHGSRIGRLDRQIRLDGALDLATSLRLDRAAGTLTPDLGQVLRGALKSGMLGTDSKGALANPLVIGGLGFLLANSDQIFA